MERLQSRWRTPKHRTARGDHSNSQQDTSSSASRGSSSRSSWRRSRPFDWNPFGNTPYEEEDLDEADAGGTSLEPPSEKLFGPPVLQQSGASLAPLGPDRTGIPGSVSLSSYPGCGPVSGPYPHEQIQAPAWAADAQASDYLTALPPPKFRHIGKLQLERCFLDSVGPESLKLTTPRSR